MPNIHVGCAGWAYKDWKGSFYPKSLQSSEYLSYYSKFFDFVEINSTFYNIPSENTINLWGEKTPDKFRFSVKIWKDITHSKNYFNIREKINSFFKPFHSIQNKISIYLLQFPPNFRYTTVNLEKLQEILELLPVEIKYAIELRNNSWFDEKIIGKLNKSQNKYFVLSYRFKTQIYYPEAQRIQYIRMIGDRDLTKFNKIQRKKIGAFNEVYKLVQNYSKMPQITDVFVIFNNHFRGFSPHDVNEFKKKMGLPFKKFNKQANLFDYIK